MNKIFSLAVLFLLVAVSASADIYRWVDNRGVVSFTDNPASIPAQFRGKAVLMDAPEPAVQEVVSESKEGKSTSPDTRKPTSATDGAEKKKLYAGKDEAAWKRDIARAQFELAEVEKQINALNERLRDTEKMSRGEYLNLQSTLKVLEIRRTNQKSKLDSLLESASNAGLPE